MKKDNCNYDDFGKLDIRVGEIKEAHPMENSNKLMVFSVDFGEDYGVVTILSGIAKWYTPEDFIGKKYAFIANLEPRKMGSETSNGMMIMADTTDHPTLIQVSNDIPNGTIVR